MKKKNFATIVYEESVNKNYIDILEKSMLQVAISPVHDKDLKEDKSGEYKKPHRHILISWESATTQNNARELIESFGGVGVEPVESKKGYYEYLTHKNNEDKAKYNEEDIIKLNGFHITENEDKFTYKQIEEYKKVIIKIVRDLDMHEYATLIDYLQDNNLNDLLEVASSKTMFFNGYISSRRYSIANTKEKIYNEIVSK